MPTFKQAMGSWLESNEMDWPTIHRRLKEDYSVQTTTESIDTLEEILTDLWLFEGEEINLDDFEVWYKGA